MTTLIKIAALTALFTGYATSAIASEGTPSPLLAHVELFETSDGNPDKTAGDASSDTSYGRISTALSNSAKIAVARLDGGRLIPTPFGEEFDWELLNKRAPQDISLLNAGDYLKYIPEIPFHGVDTDNKIDEIRITAAAEGNTHVLIYGVGPDAYWASFGGKALRDTGLIIGHDCESWGNAKAKALLVNSYSGEVLGAVTAQNIDYNIGELADNVGILLSSLTRT